MQMSQKAILRIIAAFNNALTLLDPACLIGQNAVELKSCGQINAMPFGEYLLPIKLRNICRIFPLDMVMLTPIPKSGSTIVSPEQGLRELVEPLRDSLQSGDRGGVEVGEDLKYYFVGQVSQ